MANVVASLNAQIGIDASRYQRGANQINRANREIVREQQRIRREQERVRQEFARGIQGLRNYALRVTAISTVLGVGVRRFAAMGDELQNLSDRLGISVDELQTLGLAADRLGIPFQKATQSISTFQVRFARLGLDTSSFRTELTALNPALLEQLDNVNDTTEAFRLYTEEITRLRRAGRELEALRLLQAGFGQGGAQQVGQLLDAREDARGTLAGAGALVTSENTQALSDLNQTFSDTAAILRGQVLNILSDFSADLRSVSLSLRELGTDTIPAILAFGKVFLNFATGLSEFFSSWVPITAAVVLAFTGLRRAVLAVTDVLIPFFNAIRSIGLRRLVSGGTPLGRQVFTAEGLAFGAGATSALAVLTEYFNILDRLDENRAIQGATLNPLGQDTAERLRRFQQGASAGGPLGSRQSLFRLANEIYTPEQLNAILASRGVDESQRPSAAVLDLSRAAPGDPFGRRPPSARETAEFNRRQNEAVRRALTGTANILFPPSVFTPGAQAAAEGPTDPEGERLAALIGAERNRLFQFYQSRVFTGPSRGRRLDEDFGVGDTRELDRSIRDLAARNEALEIAIEEAVASNILRNESLAALSDPLTRGGRSPAEVLREANELLSEDVVRRSRIGELGRFLEDAASVAARSEPAFRALLVDTFLDAENRTEALRGAVRRLIADLLDYIAIQPFVGYIGQGISSFIGGLGGGGGAAPGSPNPGLGTPPPITPPGFPTAAGFNASAASSATGAPINITINGVEDQRAFENVSEAVIEQVVPIVQTRLAANANRPGPVRVIRGY